MRPHYISGSVGFESGKPVLVVLPEDPADEPQEPAHDGLEAFALLLDSILRSKDRNRTVEVLAFCFKLGGAAQGFDELGERLGVSARQARNIVSASLEDPAFKGLSPDKLDDVSKPAL